MWVKFRSPSTVRPSVPLEEYRSHETRFQMLQRLNPQEAEDLAKRAQKVANRKWSLYEELATHKASIFDPYVE